MVYDAPLCRVGGVASHNMDGTTIGVLMEHVVWKPATNVSRRHVRVDSIRVATAGVERSREAAFYRGGCPAAVRAACTFTPQRVHRTIGAEPTIVHRSPRYTVQEFGYRKDDNKPEGGMARDTQKLRP